MPFVFAYYASRPCRSLTELDVKIESYVCFGRCRCRDVKVMLKTGASQASSEKFMRLRQEFVTTDELSAVHGRSTKFLQASSASFLRYSVKPKATSMRRPSIIFSTHTGPSSPNLDSLSPLPVSKQYVSHSSPSPPQPQILQDEGPMSLSLDLSLPSSLTSDHLHT